MSSLENQNIPPVDFTHTAQHSPLFETQHDAPFSTTGEVQLYYPPTYDMPEIPAIIPIETAGLDVDELRSQLEVWQNFGLQLGEWRNGLDDAIAHERHERAKLSLDSVKTIVGKNNDLAEANIDSLTGLPNVNVFDREFPAFVERHAREDQSDLALGVIDLNGLKRVNESLGHPAGNVYIRETIDAVRSVLRPEDRAYRWGGDEFAIVMPGFEGDENTVKDLIARAKEAVADHVDLPADLFTGISIGIYPLQPGDTPQSALEVADSKLGADKQAFNATLPKEVLEADPRLI